MGGGGKMGKTQSSGAGGLQRWKEREREKDFHKGGAWEKWDLLMMVTPETLRWLRPAPSLWPTKPYKSGPWCLPELPQDTLPIIYSPPAVLASGWSPPSKAWSYHRAFAPAVLSAQNAHPPIIHSDATNTYVVCQHLPCAKDSSKQFINNLINHFFTSGFRSWLKGYFLREVFPSHPV